MTPNSIFIAEVGTDLVSVLSLGTVNLSIQRQVKVVLITGQRQALIRLPGH